MTTAPREEYPRAVALPPAQETELDRMIAAPEAAHPGQSGFRLVGHGPEAFAIRARSALLAGRSLDVQTYIWHADTTGSYLYNLPLSQQRAASVIQFLLSCDELVQYRGFMQRYLIAGGRSNTEPVIDEASKRISDSQSRRIQIDFRMNDTKLIKDLIEKVEIQRAGAP